VSAYQYYKDSSAVLSDILFGFSNNDGRIQLNPGHNIIADLINLFEDIFGGGGPSAPPPRPYDLAASHAPEAYQIGIIPSLAPNQGNVAEIEVEPSSQGGVLEAGLTGEAYR
jgi:hypothetical protein